jgi:MFS family permease
VEHSNQKSTDKRSALPSRIGTGPAGAPGRIIRDIAFYALLYAFLWQMVGVHLIFHGAGLITNFPSFYTTWGFFTEHLSAPGGPVEYLSTFLSQLFYYSWLGALVITIQAWMLGLCAAYLLRVSGFKRGQVIRYVPALLLAVLYGRYTYFLPTTMALLAALLCACAYVAVAQRKALGSSLIVFLLLSLACYYGAGGAFLLFALVGVIYELMVARRWRLGLAYMAVAVGLPFIVGALGFGLIEVYSVSLPISWQLLDYEPRTKWIELAYALYLLVPAVMLAGGFWSILESILRGRKTDVSAKSRKHPSKRGSRQLGHILSWYRQSPTLNWTVQTVVVLSIGTTVAFGSFDGKQRNWFAVDYFAAHEMWPEVIAAGRRQANERFVMHAVDRALCHTGRLGDEMFRWPQRPEYLFLTNVPPKQAFWPTSNVYLEMGLLNAAEHALTECLEGLGDRPMILQRLALVNLVKDNIGTARVYLGALDRTLFHRDWARQYIELLHTDPNLTTDRHVQQLRSITLEHEFPSVAPPTPQMLEELLKKNPRNRMAFEYMMTSYLLNKQLATFAKHLQQFEDVGYATLPTHFEEAALAYVYGTRKPLHLGNYEPREKLRRQIEGFLGILKRHRGDKRAALAELVSQYGSTYMFYHIYAQPD